MCVESAIDKLSKELQATKLKNQEEHKKLHERIDSIEVKVDRIAHCTDFRNGALKELGEAIWMKLGEAMARSPFKSMSVFFGLIMLLIPVATAYFNFWLKLF